MESSELVVIEKINAVELFTGDKIDPLLEGISKKAKSFVADIETDKGRKEIASMAFAVAKAKTGLDKLGKELVSDWKTKAKAVDVSRKHIRDYLDVLKDEVRKPLTDWEEEQKRIEEEKKEREELMSAWDEALVENDLFDRQREIERKEAEFARAEEERRIEAERQAQIKAEAERKEREEKERIEREQRIAKEAAEKEKRKHLEIKRQAGIARQGSLAAIGVEMAPDYLSELNDATWMEIFNKENDKYQEAQNEKYIEKLKAKREQEKKEAAELAEKQKQAAIEEANRKAKEEADRKEAERLKKEREEQARLEAKRIAAEKKAKHHKHQKMVNNAALADFMQNGIDEDAAKEIIRLVASGVISYMSVNY